MSIRKRSCQNRSRPWETGAGLRSSNLELPKRQPSYRRQEPISGAVTEAGNLHTTAFEGKHKRATREANTEPYAGADQAEVPMKPRNGGGGKGEGSITDWVSFILNNNCKRDD
jgi:hypothetical protein